MESTPQPPAKWQAPFFSLWTGQAISLVTSELVQFALPLWLLGTSQSAIVVANAAMLALLPRALLGPLAGAWVDRWNRRAVMIVSDGITALALLCLSWLVSAGEVPVWQVYAVVFVRAVSGCFQMPAMFATTALMVPKKHLTRVAGMNQLAKGLVMVAAPVLGAYLLRVLPFQSIVVMDVGGALLALVPLLFIRVPQPPAPQLARQQPEGVSTTKPSVWRDVWDGLRYLHSWAGAVGMLALSVSINFIARPAFSPLLAVLVQDRFGGSSGEYGWMMAAFGGGVVSGGLLLSVWGGFRRKMQTSLVGVLAMGLAILALGLLPPPALALGIGAMFVGGLMTPLTMGPIQALVQTAVEPAMQGRVITLMDSTSTLIAPLSLSLAGPLFESLGPQAWYLGGGLAAVLIGLAGFATPAILNLGAPPMDGQQNPTVTEPVWPRTPATNHPVHHRAKGS